MMPHHTLAAALMLLAAGRAAASPCLGEFVLEPGTGECVLAANNGDPDEPLASHPRCPGSFACPAGGCADSPAEYARCVGAGFVPERTALGAEESELLDVHIVAHTHDDTGYLETVDEYYNDKVASILTTVTAELQKNPLRRFTYVETAFLAKWWSEQSNSTKQAFRGLLESGQMDFSNGGWCMPDEGAPSYQDMLANMQKGLRFIVEQFGPEFRPRVAWSIDPFGHSSSYAVLNRMFGFDFFVVGRIDFQEKAARFASKTMETVWRPAEDSTGSEILTHVLDPIQFYSYPPGFGFEGDARTWVTSGNVASRAKDFADFIHTKAAGYATNSLLVPFGSDFQYANASINYDNMDRLMAFMNTPENQAKFGMKLQYSTPTRYMEALKSKQATWPVKTDDFESYAIGPDQFLVGFYSSRPDYKGFIRLASSQLRAATVALTGAVLLDSSGALRLADELAALDLQRDYLGVAQHHDAITSSQRRHVHRDYIKQLSMGQVAVDGSITRTVAAAIASGAAPRLVTCPYLNESSCPFAENTTSKGPNASLAVVLQNPTALQMEAVTIRVPVGSPAVVVDGQGNPVPSQNFPPWPTSPFVHNQTHKAPAATVAFLAQVPALGSSTYFVKQAANPPTPIVQPNQGPIVLDNGIIRAGFDPSGLLAYIQNLQYNVTVLCNQSIKYYRASTGKNDSTNPYFSAGAQGSGNYIFQPVGSTTYPFTASGKPASVAYLKSDVVSEVRLVWVAESIEQVYRLAKGSDVLEVEYRIGPIDTSDGVGKEVISLWSTDIDSGEKWTSDVNGMLLKTRTRNSRGPLYVPNGPEYFNQTDPVAGNYFAVNTQAYLTDGKRRLTILTDRSQGGTSLQSGDLELMLHRRLVKGCRWGMCEPGPDGKMEAAGLNDVLGAQVVIKHWISVDVQAQDGSSPALTRQRARQLNYPPSVLLGDAGSSEKWPHSTATRPLLQALPQNVELTTFQLMSDQEALLRLTHIHQANEHPTLSQPVTVDICAVFGSKLCSRLRSMVEMTAAGDVPLDTITRHKWSAAADDAHRPDVPTTRTASNTSISLHPGAIRTFQLLLAPMLHAH